MPRKHQRLTGVGNSQHGKPPSVVRKVETIIDSRARPANPPSSHRVGSAPPRTLRPKLPIIKGNGDYVTDLALKAVEPAIDWGVQKVKGGLSSLWDWISGSGDYKIRSNSLAHDSRGQSLARGPPQFREGARSVVISHREFLKTVTGSPDFNATFIDINPGNSALLPLMHAAARTFEQYRIHGMVLEYKSMSTTYSSTVGLGTVMMATSYNTGDPLYSSRADMLNEYFACDGKSSENFLHAIECERRQTTVDELFVATPTSQIVDPALYHLGRFCIATEGSPAEMIGELWVSYEIEFFKPRYDPSGAASTGMDAYAGLQISTNLNSPQGATDLIKCPGSGLQTELQYSSANGDQACLLRVPAAGKYFIHCGHTRRGAITVSGPGEFPVDATTLVSFRRSLDGPNDTTSGGVLQLMANGLNNAKLSGVQADASGILPPSVGGTLDFAESYMFYIKTNSDNVWVTVPHMILAAASGVTTWNRYIQIFPLASSFTLSPALSTERMIENLNARLAALTAAIEQESNEGELISAHEPSETPTSLSLSHSTLRNLAAVLNGK